MDSYSDIREQLRQQYALNKQQVCNTKMHQTMAYKNTNNVQENTQQDASWAFSIKCKIFVFLSCVMLFSLYLYGGQDVKKGAILAWQEMNQQLSVLEEKEPKVKEAMQYIRNTYQEAKERIEDYE